MLIPFDSQKDKEYQDGWQRLTDFLLGGFIIPDMVSGDPENETYSSLFASLKQLKEVKNVDRMRNR